MPDFEDAREETIRYHDELYADASLGEEGTWLAQPDPLIFEALRCVPHDRPVIAYDLGAGIGRHTVIMLERLPEGSEVHAIDLLESAVEQLKQLDPIAGATRLHVRRQDLADLELAGGADLVFAFSAVEHLPDRESIRRLLDSIRSALRPGGVVALGIIVDRVEIADEGRRRPALLESDLTTVDVDALLRASFTDLETVSRRDRPARIEEERDGETYTLASTLISWIGRLAASSSG
ncbi:trans-aconitate 2-methyltransferase [uncultured Microbacterium sp.]|uniref:class I SAM-dependent methyltransferase n=1 Tax=uncultured Microbacterium sp. TaxID=191216 RepID=UPI002637C75A|nr:class I SAM-dependent methyltransferase [uncultured Microbacterium sp.]